MRNTESPSQVVKTELRWTRWTLTNPKLNKPRSSISNQRHSSTWTWSQKKNVITATKTPTTALRGRDDLLMNKQSKLQIWDTTFFFHLPLFSPLHFNCSSIIQLFIFPLNSIISLVFERIFSFLFDCCQIVTLIFFYFIFFYFQKCQNSVF